MNEKRGGGNRGGGGLVNGFVGNFGKEPCGPEKPKPAPSREQASRNEADND